jgi:hypothetical protein
MTEAILAWEHPTPKQTERWKAIRERERAKPDGNPGLWRAEHPVLPLLATQHRLTVDACRRIAGLLASERVPTPLALRILLEWPDANG